MAEKTGVQSVERIFQLIEQLAAHPTGVSLQKLAGETGLAKAPCTACWQAWWGWAMWRRTTRMATTG